MYHTLLYVLTLFWLFCEGVVEAVAPVNIFAVDFPIVAYVVASKDATTTYAIGCTAGSDTKTCNFVQPYTLVQGPKTLSFEFTAPQSDITQTLTLACELSSTTSLGCTATGNNDSPVETTQSFTYTGKTAAAYFSAVPLVTNRAALMSYTPGATTSSTKAVTTAKAISTPSSAGVSSTAEVASSTGSMASTRTSSASLGRNIGGGVLGICLPVLVMLITGG